ncbi:hypothetical protein Tco_0754932 [Tanacetum coccineum]
MPTEMELTLERTQQGVTLEQTQQGVSYEVSFDESDTYVLERFDTSAGNPVKEILLKLNLPDHRYLKMEVKRQSVKVKEIQERCSIKAFQDYQIKKGMSMSVQNHKFTIWQNLQDGKTRLCLDDDFKKLKDHIHVKT